MIAIIDYKAGNLTSVKLGLEFLGIECEITSASDRIFAAERVIFPGVGAAGAAMAHLRESGLADTIRTVVSRGTPFLGICLGTQVIFEFSEEDGGTQCIGLVPGRVVRFALGAGSGDPRTAVVVRFDGQMSGECASGIHIPDDQVMDIPDDHESGGHIPDDHSISGSCASGQNASRSISTLCKIPQMGWNAVEILRPHPLFEGIESSSEFYFVHSYYPAPSDESYAIGFTDYAGVRFASAVGKDNLFAVQFHPERSGRIGLRMLDNFSRWDGKC